MTLQPKYVNESYNINTYAVGMCLNAIILQQNDYGYDLDIGKYKGFIET